DFFVGHHAPAAVLAGIARRAVLTGELAEQVLVFRNVGDEGRQAGLGIIELRLPEARAFLAAFLVRLPQPLQGAPQLLLLWRQVLLELGGVLLRLRLRFLGEDFLRE